MEQNETNELIRPGESPKWVGSLYEMAEVLVSAMLCVAVLFIFLLRFAGVLGHSMDPTLEDRQKLALTASLPRPAHGDIVIISPRTNADHEPLVKRVIAVEGDELDLADGRVLVNGTAIDEPYLPEGVRTEPAPGIFSDLVYPVRVPAGTVFVMGDNRGGSMDSRFSDVGLIRADDIIGKVLFSVKPFLKSIS